MCPLDIFVLILSPPDVLKVPDYFTLDMELKVTPAVEVSSVLVALEALGLHSVVEVKREDAGGEDVQLTTKDGELLTFANVILRHLGECAPNNDLYGDLSVQEKAQVYDVVSCIIVFSFISASKNKDKNRSRRGVRASENEK